MTHNKQIKTPTSGWLGRKRSAASPIFALRLRPLFGSYIATGNIVWNLKHL